MPTTDERKDDEEIQPGDTVIELRDGKPVLYTQREGETSATSTRKGRSPSAEASPGS
jgi:hypothetical protein